MRIAITGAAGRVGRTVVRRALSDGHQVVAVDRVATPGVERAVVADLAEYGQVLQALRGCDGLVHLAALPSPRGRPPQEVHNNNVVASYNALCAAVEAGIERICLASSVNAVGGVYSRRPRYDYFPVDERHPTYNEDPYSLSKWVAEQQADSVARRHPGLTIGSLRLHFVARDREEAATVGSKPSAVRDLWGYTLAEAAAGACLRVLAADWRGHERFYAVAPITSTATPSEALAREHYPDTPIRGSLAAHRGFFDCGKAARLLGWTHPGGD